VAGRRTLPGPGRRPPGQVPGCPPRGRGPMRPAGPRRAPRGMSSTALAQVDALQPGRARRRWAARFSFFFGDEQYLAATGPPGRRFRFGDGLALAGAPAGPWITRPCARTAPRRFAPALGRSRRPGPSSPARGLVLIPTLNTTMNAARQYIAFCGTPLERTIPCRVSNFFFPEGGTVELQTWANPAVVAIFQER